VAAFANKPARLVSAFHGTPPTRICLFKRRPLYKIATEASQSAGYLAAVAKRGRGVSDDTMAAIADTVAADTTQQSGDDE